MPRARPSHSPLARPATDLHRLAAAVADHMHFPDPAPLYVVLGTVAANMTMGVPVWLMLVGAPSSGRTFLIECLAEVEGVHVVSSIKGPGALLSGTAKREVRKGATGGMLGQIGCRGLLAMKDFTSVLSLPSESRMETIAALREIYDGRWARPVGSDGGKFLNWQGSIGFIGASTPAIDNQHRVTAELGERWIYYRYPASSGFGESMRALQSVDRERTHVRLRALVREFVERRGLRWSCVPDCKQAHHHTRGPNKRVLEGRELHRLVRIASLAVRLRSVVPRDGYTKELLGMAPVNAEGPPRLAGMLGQLYLGLETIGLPEVERWPLIGKVALDSAPQVRREVGARLMQANGRACTVEELREALQCGKHVMDRCLEDMQLHGLVVRVRGECRMTDWARREWEGGIGVQMERHP